MKTLGNQGPLSHWTKMEALLNGRATPVRHNSINAGVTAEPYLRNLVEVDRRSPEVFGD